jgi:hypothetical protein
MNRCRSILLELLLWYSERIYIMRIPIQSFHTVSVFNGFPIWWKSSTDYEQCSLCNTGQLTSVVSSHYLIFWSYLASITSASSCFTCGRAGESSWFYTFYKVPKACEVEPTLTTYCPKKGLNVGITGVPVTTLFTDRLIRCVLTFMSAKFVYT